MSVGNMVSDPTEKAYIVYVYPEEYGYEFKFTQIDLFYSADSITDVDCVGSHVNGEGSCTFIVEGAGLRMIELVSSSDNVNITKYVNYKNYGDYKSLRI